MQQTIYEPGSHFKNPLTQQETVFDIKMRAKSQKATTPTKDMQQVRITVRLLHRPEVDKLPTILSDIGKDYEAVILPSVRCSATDPNVHDIQIHIIA